MPAYKRQHFLPTVYLAQFGRPAERAPEHRLIWRTSETHYAVVPVGSQCQRDYFYSKHRATFCEKYFAQIEGTYGLAMRAIAQGIPLSQEALFLFFLCAVDFYARGVKFKVRDDQEEFARYLHRMDIFKRKLINPALELATDDERRAYLLKNWEFTIIPFPEVAVLTSDSPAIWLTDSQMPDVLKGVLMPLTPQGVFVGVHRGSYRLMNGIGTAADASVITRNEIENCVDAVFFSDPFEPEELAIVRKHLAARSQLRPIAQGWQFEMIEYDQSPHLSFILPT